MKRLEGETFEAYKDRQRQLEKEINKYLKGVRVDNTEKELKKFLLSQRG